MTLKPILLLQMQRMGDLILSYPLMLWLSRRYPGHPIFVAAEETFFKPLMKLSPAVTYFPWSGANVLKQHDYALVINLSIQKKAAQLAEEVSAEHKLGPVQSADSATFVHGDWQLYRTSLVKNNGFNRYHWADLNGLDAIPFKQIVDTRFDNPRTMHGSNKVGLFLGASDEAKRPSVEFWGTLVDELHRRDLRPVLFGGPMETGLGEAVVKQAKGPALNMCGKLGLEELGIVGQTLGLFITPDTGPMHLAAWTGLRCLNLSLGNVNPWETGPYGPGHHVLRADLDCAKGCWSCSRQRLYCHDPFKPARVAILANRILAGDGPDQLAGLDLPGLTLFQTARSDLGLYHLNRLDAVQPDEERLISRFWQTFFGHHFGLWDDTRQVAAWADLTAEAGQTAEAIRAHVPEMGRQFKHGLKNGSILEEAFWAKSPATVKPLTGYAHMLLENTDYSRLGWIKVMELLERLIAACA
ncbi:glycosyltransferase family 9 protein [Pseudodesulfovibrio sediminis]|uniref:Heptosyltransferase n=1 Tax=Pseudodesulfovibrio sediminis TaxID=2810563 RepID=A0ABM9SDT6_9BACT|nr:glycosyltransferase family 9 protein [Pseudodesulfovibrio sediminis]BCS89395.1 heptosyltransferase [Pseudodesulfovibrio sediminis]